MLWKSLTVCVLEYQRQMSFDCEFQRNYFLCGISSSLVRQVSVIFWFSISYTTTASCMNNPDSIRDRRSKTNVFLMCISEEIFFVFCIKLSCTSSVWNIPVLNKLYNQGKCNDNPDSFSVWSLNIKDKCVFNLNYKGNIFCLLHKLSCTSGVFNIMFLD